MKIAALMVNKSGLKKRKVGTAKVATRKSVNLPTISENSDK